MRGLGKAVYMTARSNVLDGIRLGLGVSSLGNLYKVVDDATARATVETAWAEGIRYFDTAPFYGFGYSERRAGDLLRQFPRDEFVLSTKVGRLLTPAAKAEDKFGFKSPMPFDPVHDYSYDGVMRSFEDSLQRLGLSRIDILLMHDIGRYTHGAQHDHYWAQATSGGGFRAMDELRAQGAIRAIGLGVNEIEVCDLAADHVDLDYILLAGRYTLIEHAPLEGFFDRCLARGVGIIAAGVYNSGILATGTRSGGELHYDYGEPPADVVERVAAIEAVCDEFGIPLAQAALQFPSAHPAVSTTLVGMTGERRVRSTVEQFATMVPPAFWGEMKHQGLLPEGAPVPMAEVAA